MNSNSTEISLYIHIPFCSSKCNYCDFYSEVNLQNKIPNVISEIINQLNSRLELLGNPIIKTIFIGGGTPSFLPISELRRVLIRLQELSLNVTEWTIESNPESITKEFLLTCQEYGVNRLSVGIQTTDNESLKILGRKSQLINCETALKLIKEHWKKKFSLDFISSVPGQTKELIQNDINFAIKYKPDHISLYALSIEEGTKLEDEISKGNIDELDNDTSADIWEYGRELLLQNGYNNYEVSNYTKDSPCLHNINYWELKPYLGIGPGAVSTLILNNKIVRITNKKSVYTFIKGQEMNWGESIEEITPKDFLEDYIIMGFRLSVGINKSRFYKIFGKEIVETISISSKLKNDKLLEETETHVKLTQKGFDIMNNILVDMLENLDTSNISNISWTF